MSKFKDLNSSNFKRLLIFFTNKELSLIITKINKTSRDFVLKMIYEKPNKDNVSLCIKELKSNIKTISDIKFLLNNHSEALEESLRKFIQEFKPFILYSTLLILPCLLLSNQITLDFNQLNIGCDGIIILSKYIEQTKILQSLFLGYNNISDDGSEFLKEPLRKNKSIANLNLECNQITDIGFSNLTDVLVSKTTLKNLKFSLNLITNDSMKQFATKLSLREFPFEILEFKYNNIVFSDESGEIYKKYKIFV